MSAMDNLDMALAGDWCAGEAGYTAAVAQSGQGQDSRRASKG